RPRARPARRAAGALSHQHRQPQTGPRVDQPVRALLAPPAHAREGTRRAAVAFDRPDTGGHMAVIAPGIDQLTLDITEEMLVRAPIARALASLLEELGPATRGHEDTPMPMLLEPWPGGRWFRDLGNGN